MTTARDEAVAQNVRCSSSCSVIDYHLTMTLSAHSPTVVSRSPPSCASISSSLDGTAAGPRALRRRAGRSGRLLTLIAHYCWTASLVRTPIECAIAGVHVSSCSQTAAREAAEAAVRDAAAAAAAVQADIARMKAVHALEIGGPRSLCSLCPVCLYTCMQCTRSLCVQPVSCLVPSLYVSDEALYCPI